MFAQYEGAIAAPTAGLHFTHELVDALKAGQVGLAQVTLHVGPGTFQSVKSERIEDHRMMAEWIDVPADTVQQIRQVKAEGRRVIAIGTTVVRALESAARNGAGIAPYRGTVELFITPGFQFHVVDALLTNFHLPRTTLLMLVSALTGIDSLRAPYAEAVAQRYRFYSYGDAMLIGTGWRGTT